MEKFADCICHTSPFARTLTGVAGVPFEACCTQRDYACSKIGLMKVTQLSSIALMLRQQMEL